MPYTTLLTQSPEFKLFWITMSDVRYLEIGLHRLHLSAGLYTEFRRQKRGGELVNRQRGIKGNVV